MEAQILDTMELERERGITIKEQSVRLNYTYEDGETYELNLIDTPGHVDFNYEVSRSLSACEGAILIIDATQGVQAQTLANVYLALDHDLEIIPVINKVDLPSADVERVKTEVENVIGLDMSEAIPVSAKTGQNVEEVLKRIVEQVPPPEGDAKSFLYIEFSEKSITSLSRFISSFVYFTPAASNILFDERTLSVLRYLSLI